jgi:hypothetical protein
MFVESRDDARRFFCEVWQKAREGHALEPLEAIVAQTITAHPEYHAVLTDSRRALERDFNDGGQRANPFLHMGLHIALHEQLQTDRPVGIRRIYADLCGSPGADRHLIEHRMMGCLGAALQAAQEAGMAPDETAYLDALKDLERHG